MAGTGLHDRFCPQCWVAWRSVEEACWACELPGVISTWPGFQLLAIHDQWRRVQRERRRTGLLLMA